MTDIEVVVSIGDITTTAKLTPELLVDLHRSHGVDGLKACIDVVADETITKFKEVYK